MIGRRNWPAPERLRPPRARRTPKSSEWVSLDLVPEFTEILGEDGTWQEAELPEPCTGELVVRLHSLQYETSESSALPATDVLAQQGIVSLGVAVLQCEERCPYVPGDRLLVFPTAPCGRCTYCLEGHAAHCRDGRRTNFLPSPLAREMVLPSWTVQRGMLRLTEQIAFESLEFLMQLATVHRALGRLAKGSVHSRVLVLGSDSLAVATGWVLERQFPDVRRVGLSAKPFGYPVIASGFHEWFAEPDDDRAIEVGRLAFEEKARLVVLTESNPSQWRRAWELVSPGGTILSLDDKNCPMDVDLGRLVREEIRITGTSGCTPEDARLCLPLLLDRQESLAELSIRASTRIDQI